MPKLNLCSLVAGEYLILGLILLIDPDAFFNPEDGLFKAISGARSTELESNHFDPMFNIITQLKGAGIASLAVSILMIRDEMTRNDVLRTGLYFHLLLVLVYGHATITANENDKYFNLALIGFYTGHFFGYMLWFLAEVVASKKDTIKRTPASLPRILSLVAFVVLTGPAAFLDVYDPHHTDPGKPMSFWSKATLPDNTKDELAAFQCRASGAILLAFVFSAIEALAFDRSFERLRWFNQCGAVANALYLTVFVRAALDDTGYVYKRAWVMLSLITTLSLVGQIGDLLFVGNSDTGNRKVIDAKSEKVPDLTTEEQEKKLK